MADSPLGRSLQDRFHRRLTTADECFSYVALDDGAAGAQPGRHDDRVIAAAIAWQVRQRPRPSFLIARA